MSCKYALIFFCFFFLNHYHMSLEISIESENCCVLQIRMESYHKVLTVITQDGNNSQDLPVSGL